MSQLTGLYSVTLARQESKKTSVNRIDSSVRGPQKHVPGMVFGTRCRKGKQKKRMDGVDVCSGFLLLPDFSRTTSMQVGHGLGLGLDRVGYGQVLGRLIPNAFS